MLYYSDEKDILSLKDSDIAVIIPVNCVGVMGAGLAKQFADKYPEMVPTYKDCCDTKQLSIGHCVFENSIYGKFIFFPSKDDWKDDSKLEYIEEGMNSVVRCLNYFSDLKIAIPPIGCGLGKLNRSDVISIIYDKTKDCKNEIYLVGW